LRTATVIGAGVFGAWIAHALNRRGWKVTLVDQYGPGNSRATSGGETRIIRSGYGSLVTYARWARESLPLWLDLERASHERLFIRTGALFLARELPWLEETAATLQSERIATEWIDPSEFSSRFPQLRFSGTALFEPDAGVLFARRAVQSLVRIAASNGVTVETRAVNATPEISTNRSDALVFACGPWLPQLFPEAIGDAIVPTRQEVFFFGVPAGDLRFRVGSLPAWIAFDEGVYGLPDLEYRGAKVAIDSHGAPVNPDTMDRIVDAGSVGRVRALLRERVPALAEAPLLESRVCQYENTTDGHFLLDRLPGHDRVWIAGGGSGHGFKHGPAVGRYMSDLIERDAIPDPVFRFESRPARKRRVF
jgi:monomeric sarcosine oxidase